eukprot:jgi/Tetstr1/441725/TSEL_029948.t1
MLSTLAEAAALVASVFAPSPDNNDAGSGDNHGSQVNIGKVEVNAKVLLVIGSTVFMAASGAEKMMSAGAATASMVAKTAATAAAAAPAAAVAGVAVVAAGAYCAPIAAHAYKANTRSALGDDTVRMWLRPINQTVVFRVTGGGEAQYAMLDGKFLEESSLEKKLGAWTNLLTPPPGDIAPEDMGLHARYQRLRKYGDCLRLCRVDAMWHGGYSFCVIQLGSKVECKVHPGKVSEATMEEWLE